MPSFINHHPRPHFSSNNSSNRSSYSAPSPSPSPPPTIHHRRTVASRTNSTSSRNSPPPPCLPQINMPLSPFNTTQSKQSDAISSPEIALAPPFLAQNGESDAECWSRMLALQREYHCYNSARLEAAVEALERGMRFEEVPVPSRFCLDLLNEELQASIDSLSYQ